MTSQLAEPAIEECMLADRHRFNKRQATQKTQAQVLALIQDMQNSKARALSRKASVDINFPNDLPITQRLDDIGRALERNQVIVVAGETGSGKTTQLPKLLLKLGYGVFGTIGHTQPRRLAARAVANRITDELQSTPGDLVGYKVRFDDQTRETCRIKLMTDGILLSELHHDRGLYQYDCLIIDEAHERSLNIDFLLGYLRGLLRRRPELKLVITSATLNTQRFSKHFDNAPIIEVSGRTYPVQMRYRPLEDQDIPSGIIDSIIELRREGTGDILVFLPGERDIREVKNALQKRFVDKLEILPLFGRLTSAEQQRIFSNGSKSRVILATNIAETSLTVPGIHYVIDTGIARISRYNYRTKVQRLPIEAVSQASANQRAGRCGRVADGICIRLYSEADYDARSEYTDPELLRTNLASVILQMALLDLGGIESFPFVDQPDSKYVKDGYRLLRELQALDLDDKITPRGRKIASFPVDPRFGRMLVEASSLGVTRQLLVIVAGLSIQDPRERPLEQAEKADLQHRVFEDESSDFLTLLNLWASFHEQRKALSRKQFKQWCFDHFLSQQRLFEWVDVHNQLKQLVGKTKKSTQDPKIVHQAIVPGLLSHFGTKSEAKEYEGARGSCFQIFPGSVLAKKKPPWIMAASLVETSRLFARTVAPVRPEWIEKAAHHLVKRTYSDHHWREKIGQVMAAEQVSLYGVVLIGKRWVKISGRKADQARVVFLQSALVEGRLGGNPPDFLQHNLQLRADIEAVENKQRRRNVLVGEAVMSDFYAQRIPQEMASRHSLLKWLEKADQSTRQSLYMTRRDLLGGDGDLPSVADYPDYFDLDGNRLPLTYVFDANSDVDGVTLQIPVALLPQLTEEHLDYMVPGFLNDKLVALIKGLPKLLRKNFVPAPDFAQACLDKWAQGKESKPLLANLSHTLNQMTGTKISREVWGVLPSHLRVNVLVQDDKAEILCQGRSLQALSTELKNRGAQSQQISNEVGLEKGLKTWDFENFLAEVQVRRSGVLLTRYVALKDQSTHVDQVLLESSVVAQASTQLGIQRLFVLSLPQQAKAICKKIVDNQRLVLAYRPLGNETELADDVLCAIVRRVFMGKPIDGRVEFERALAQGRSELLDQGDKLINTVSLLLKTYHDVRIWQDENANGPLLDGVTEIQGQLSKLIFPGFVRVTPDGWLQRIPVYLEAIRRRQQRMLQNQAKDAEYRTQLALLEQELGRLSDVHGVEALSEVRWMLEEFRVSLFAQDLKTVIPVSEKRVRKKLQALDRHIGAKK